MGFFDKILQGIGFANDDEVEQIDQKLKESKQKKAKKIQNEYVLNEQKSKDLTILDFEPNSQEDVMMAVDFLKTGSSARINLEKLPPNELNRAIDFLQGACYILGIEPIFESGKKILLKQ